MPHLAHRIRTTTAIAAATILLTGCAALFSPNPQPVPVSSNPPGAQVFVDDAFVGTTPITLDLDSRQSYEVRIRAGERERVLTLASSVEASYVALDVLPGLALAGVSLAVLASPPLEGPYDTTFFPAFLRFTGSLAGIGIGTGSALVAVGVDAGTGRWYRLTPTEIVVVFD